MGHLIFLVGLTLFSQIPLAVNQPKQPPYSLNCVNDFYIFDDSFVGFKFKIPKSNLIQTSGSIESTARPPIPFAYKNPNSGLSVECSYHSFKKIPSVKEIFKNLTTPQSKPTPQAPRQIKLANIPNWEILWYITDHGTSSRLHLLTNAEGSLAIHLSAPFYSTPDDTETLLTDTLKGIRLERYNTF